MKKVIIGSFMFLAGVLSCAVLSAMSIFKELPVNIVAGEEAIHTTFIDILAEYSLTPMLYIFIAIAVIGIVVFVLELFEKN